MLLFCNDPGVNEQTNKQINTQRISRLELINRLLVGLVIVSTLMDFLVHCRPSSARATPGLEKVRTFHCCLPFVTCTVVIGHIFPVTFLSSLA